MTMKKIKTKIFLTAATICILTTSACTPTTAQRGNMLQDFQIEEVVTGLHTRSDVLRILGSPTTFAPFNQNIWYYIGQETEKRGILDPEIMEERIIIVNFDKDGIVQDINEVNSDRMNIPINRSKTATHGNDITILQQFLGNLGKFNPQEQ